MSRADGSSPARASQPRLTQKERAACQQAAGNEPQWPTYFAVHVQTNDHDEDSHALNITPPSPIRLPHAAAKALFSLSLALALLCFCFKRCSIIINPSTPPSLQSVMLHNSVSVLGRLVLWWQDTSFSLFLSLSRLLWCHRPKSSWTSPHCPQSLGVKQNRTGMQ